MLSKSRVCLFSFINGSNFVYSARAFSVFSVFLADLYIGAVCALFALSVLGPVFCLLIILVQVYYPVS